MNARVLSNVPLGSRGDQYRHDLTVCAVAVITPEISRISGGLIDVGLRREQFALQLDDKNPTTDKEDYVRPSGLERKFVLENGGVVPCEHVSEKHLLDLALQRRDGVIPGADLLR
jgi:hypothetical protein